MSDARLLAQLAREQGHVLLTVERHVGKGVVNLVPAPVKPTPAAAVTAAAKAAKASGNPSCRPDHERWNFWTVSV